VYLLPYVRPGRPLTDLEALKLLPQRETPEHLCFPPRLEEAAGEVDASLEKGRQRRPGLGEGVIAFHFSGGSRELGTQEVEEAEAVRDTGVTLPWVEGLRTLGDLQVQLIIFCVLTKLLKLFLIYWDLNYQDLMIAGDS
jgi:hypothetical protein